MQGPQLGVGALWDNIVVELGAFTQVIRPHDIREKKKLRWQADVLVLLAPVIEAHGTETQRKLMRAAVINALELLRENVVEDLEHESVFSVVGVAV